MGITGLTNTQKDKSHTHCRDAKENALSMNFSEFLISLNKNTRKERKVVIDSLIKYSYLIKGARAERTQTFLEACNMKI